MDNDVILEYYKRKLLMEWLSKAKEEDIIKYMIMLNQRSLDKIEHNVNPKLQFRQGIVENVVGNAITDGTLLLLRKLISKI